MNRESFQSFLNRQRIKYGEKFDPSDLAPELVRYFESGDRIKLDMVGLDNDKNDVYGHTFLSGTVSVTTGWKPMFLLIQRSNAQGSPWTLSSRDHIIAVQNSRRQYVYFHADDAIREARVKEGK